MGEGKEVMEAEIGVMQPQADSGAASRSWKNQEQTLPWSLPQESALPTA